MIVTKTYGFGNVGVRLALAKCTERWEIAPIDGGGRSAQKYKFSTLEFA